MYFLYLPFPQSSDPILSFPLLEDLTMTAYGDVVTYESDDSNELSTVF